MVRARDALVWGPAWLQQGGLGAPAEDTPHPVRKAIPSYLMGKAIPGFSMRKRELEPRLDVKVQGFWGRTQPSSAGSQPCLGSFCALELESSSNISSSSLVPSRERSPMDHSPWDEPGSPSSCAQSHGALVALEGVALACPCHSPLPLRSEGTATPTLP